MAHLTVYSTPTVMCRYVVGQVHERVKHPLYAVHWVWSGSTMESKQQTIRDAMKFWDPIGEDRLDDFALMIPIAWPAVR